MTETIKEMILIAWALSWICVLLFVTIYLIKAEERRAKAWEEHCKKSKEPESIALAERDRPMNQCYKTGLQCYCIGLCKEGY